MARCSAAGDRRLNLDRPVVPLPPRRDERGGAGRRRASQPLPDPRRRLVEAITPRYRAAVLLAAWCGLRRGDLVGLYVDDADLAAATVRVRQNRVELDGGEAFDTTTKTDAGKRTVAVPPHVLPFLKDHLADWAGKDRLFVGRTDTPMRGNAVSQAFGRARAKAGMEHFTFHDMRHTGQTLAAATGATLKDLMKRMGHASTVAAYRYMHAVDGRDADIASALSGVAAHGSSAKLPRTILTK